MTAPALPVRARLAAATAGLGALLGLSFVHGFVLAPLTAWAVTPPLRVARLLLAIVACLAAGTNSLVAGRWARTRVAARAARLSTGGRPS